MHASRLFALVGAVMVLSLPALGRAAGPLIVNGAGTPLVWAVNPIPFNPEQGLRGARTNAQAMA